jgi:predicted dehydrogenase
MKASIFFMNKKKASFPAVYRSVVIGLGRIGWRMEGERHRAVPCTHAGAYQYAKRTELVGGFDIEPEQCADFQLQYPDAVVAHEGLESFLCAVQPQLISVCTSSSEHLAVLRSIHNYAGKHPETLFGILLEKPVGVSEEEGREIRMLVEEMAVPVVVCHDRRFYPWFQLLKNGLDSELTGPLRHIRGAVYASSFVKGRSGEPGRFFFGGPLLHDGTHLIDLMAYFAGKPQYVSGVCLKSEPDSRTEETCFGNIFFENGVSGSFFAGGLRRYFHFELSLEWERAMLTDANGHISFYVKEEGDFLLKRSVLPEFCPQNPYLIRLEHLLNVIEGRETCYSSIDDGLMVLETISAIYNSARHKSAIMPVGENNINKPDSCGIVDSDREVEYGGE